MKIQYNQFKIFLMAILLSLLGMHTNAQTILAPGDLFFTGYNSEPATSQDNFSFVLLKSVTAGTTIKFTDRGWYIDPGPVEGFLSTALATQDGVITWTATSTVNCGTEIYIVCEGNNALSASVGTVAGTVAQSSPALNPGQTANYIELNGSGDQLFAYQGSDASPSLLAGLDMNGGFIATSSTTMSSTSSAMPSALGTANTLVITPENDNAKYNCPTAISSGTPGVLYAALRTGSNWVIQNLNYYALPTGCTWNITGCSPVVARWVNNQGGVRPATVVINGNTVATAPTTYTTIQSAIDATFSGDFVYITNGVYRNPAELTSTNCSLFGTAQDLNLYLNVSNKTNVTITSETGNYCSSSARLVGYGFDLNGGSNITIQGLHLDSVRVNAIWNSNCCSHLPSLNVSIKNNHISNTRGHGIKTDGLEDYTRTGWLITGNFFENIGFYNGNGNCLTPAAVSAMWLSNATSFNITNNSILNTKWAGILCDGWNSVTISGNRIDQTIDAGIQIGFPSSTFFYPNGANINNNKITHANTSQKLFIGAITLYANNMTGISITYNDLSTSYNGIAVSMAGWMNSQDTKLINNNNFYCLSPGSYGFTHILVNGAPGCLCNTPDNLNFYNLTNNYWGAASGPTYPTNPSGTGVGLRKETVAQGGVIYSLNDFGFTPFLTSPVAVNFTTLTSVACPNQSVCPNSSIAPITYSTVGATGATVAGLPGGVNGTWASNQVTISGTPTIPGVYTYTVNLIGVCAGVSEQGTITVNAPPTITCPSPITTGAASPAGAIVNYAAPTFTGSPAPTIVCNPPSGSTFPIGTTTVTCTASNVCGSASCNFTVTVTQPGAALNFDGTDDYVSISNLTATTNSNYTIEGWFKTSLTNTVQDIVSGHTSGNLSVLVVEVQLNGTLRFLHRVPAGQTGGNSVYTTSIVNDGNWHHFAAVHGPDELKIYLDGSLQAQSFFPEPLSPETLNILLGRLQTGDRIFQGSMDEIRFWNRALCATEIVNNMNCEIPTTGNGLVANYHFNQGTASSDNTSPFINTLVDATGNGFTGTLNNFALNGSTSNWVAPGGVISGTNCAALAVPEANVKGGVPLINIVDGDIVPTTTDSTNFGNVNVGANKIHSFTINNTGSSTLNITSITSDNSTYTISGAPTSITAGNSATFNVTFSPTASGVQNATITINNNDCDEGVYDFAVQGTGICIDPTIPTVSASLNPICYGSSTTLSIASGTLNGATNWQWYTSSCGGTSVGSGISITVSPSVTTVYYVRGEGGCITLGSCATYTVTVDPAPSTPYWVSIATGWDFTVALKSDGTLWSWGINTYGNLGDNTTTQRNFPVQIGTATDWVAVSAGGFHACAIKSNGLLYAWGRNSSGQLGDVTNIQRLSPVQVSVLSNVVEVFCEGHTTLARKSDGTIWGWGSNINGEVGDGTNTNKIIPTQIGVATNWAGLSGGEFYSLGLKTDGTIWSWGNNINGQLGDGTVTSRNTPGQVGSATDWKAVAGGGHHTLALKTNGTLWAWGENGNGQLGDGTLIETHVPIQSGVATNWASINCGYHHSFGMKSDRSFYAWGSNVNGELGDGTNTQRSTPTLNASLSDVVVFKGGYFHSGILRCPRSTICMTGKGTNGQMGDNTVVSRNTFTCTIPTSCTAPAITCSGNLSAGTLTSCNAIVSYTYTVTGTSPTITYTFSGATTSSGVGSGTGSTFNKGTTVVTLTATNACGNQSCSFNVVITDVTAPTITCSGPVTINNTTGLCTGTTTLAAPTATDNCMEATGNALRFDGINDLVNVTNSGINLANISFTVEFWAKRNTSGTGDYVFSQGGNIASNQTLHIGFRPSNEFTFALYNNDVNVSSSFSDLNWHHWACTFDNATKVQTVYRDGIQVGQRVSSSSFLGSGNTHFYIGDAAYGSNKFDGTMDELRVWTNVRTQTQIRQNLSIELNGAQPNLAYYLKFNQGIANGNNAGLTSALPSVGSVNGTLSNFGLNGATSNWVGGVPYPIVINDAPLIYALGNTTVNWTATDSSGNTATCAQLVTVNDTTKPSITCPGNISQNNDANVCSAVVTYTVTSSDNCPGQTIAQASGLPSGSAFPVGTTINKFIVTDASGNKDSCSFNVTIIDTTKPTITCPGNISQDNDAGLCSAIVNYAAPIVSDNCPNPPSPVLLSGGASGSVFPVGSSVVTYGVPYLTSTYNFTGLTTGSINGQDGWLGTSAGFVNNNTILVNNTTPFVNPQGSGLGLLATFIGGTHTSFATRKDNVNFSIPDFDPSGMMTIQFDARQTYWGNYFQVGYDVNNNGHLSGSNEISFGVRYSIVSNNIDLLGVGGAVLASVPSSSYSLDARWRQFKLLIDKNANSGSGSISLSFRDVANNGPWIAAPALQNKLAGFNPSGTNASNPMNINGMVYSHEAGDGPTENSFLDNIIFTKYNVCSFTVNVTDTTRPSITCPGNISRNNNTNVCSAVVTYTVTSSDNCPGQTVAQASGLPSGSAFPVGTTINKFIVTDASGNKDSCSFNVTIIDTTKPTITCPGNISQDNDANLCSAVVNYTAPVGTDNCTGATTAQTSGLPSGSAFPVGVTINKFIVTDSSGNKDSCSFTVTITDTTKPTIICAADITINNSTGLCTGTTILTAPTVSDNCSYSGNALDFDGVDDRINVNTNSDSQTGTFTVECWAKAGHATNTLSILSSRYPADEGFDIKFYQGNQIHADIGDGSSWLTTTADANLNYVVGQWYHIAYVVTPTGYTIYINGLASDSGSYSGTPVLFDANHILTIGSYTQSPFLFSENYQGQIDELRIWNTARTQTQIQTNMNQELGTQCGLVAAYHFNHGIANATNTGVTSLADASANSYNGTLENFALSGSSSNWVMGQALNYTISNNAPCAFPVGNTTVTWTATDASGNTNTCTQLVTVNDTTKPTVSCPGNITQNNDAGICGALINYNTPVGVDNCPNATTLQTEGLASGAIFPVGTTINKFIVTDASGHKDSCSFTITVNDTTKPNVINCPGNQILYTTGSNCTADYAIPFPTLSDNCTGPLTWNASFSGNPLGNPSNLLGLANGTNSLPITFQHGVTTVILTATDSSGNTSMSNCSFTVTVQNVPLTSIICPNDTTVTNDAGLCGKMNWNAAGCEGYQVATIPFAPVSGTGTVVTLTDDAVSAGLPIGFDFSFYCQTYSQFYISSNGFITFSSGQPNGCCSGQNLPNAASPNNLIAGVWTDLNPGAGGTISYFTTGTAPNRQLVVKYDNVPFFGSSLTTSFQIVLNENGNNADVFISSVPSITSRTKTEGIENDNGTQALTVNGRNANNTWIATNDGKRFYPQFSLSTINNSCSGLLITNNSPSYYPVGTTPVTWTVADVSGNIVSCTQQVTVNDTEAPKSVPSSFANFESGLPGGWTVTGLWHVSSSCIGLPTPNGSNWAYYGQDANCNFNSGAANSGTLTAPTINIPASATAASIIFWKRYNGEGSPTSTTYDIARFRINGIDQPVTIDGTLYPLNGLQNGIDNQWQRVTVNANAFIGQNITMSWFFNSFDGIANNDLGLQIDSVVLLLNPFSECPQNITVNTLPGQCGANASWTAPIYSDNCGLQSVISSHNPGAFFPIGNTAVTYTATDIHSNITTCTFTVTVIDIGPEINIKGNSVSIIDGDITPSLADHSDFGQTTLAPITRTYTIENIGTANLTLAAGAITLTGANASLFAISNITLPASLSGPNGSITFDVTYTPTVLGVHTATINIASNDCDEAAYNFDIKGERTCLPPFFTSCPTTSIMVNSTLPLCNGAAVYNPVSGGIPAPVYTYHFSGATIGNGNGTGSGTVFNLGTTTVKVYATNICGVDSCIFNVVVVTPEMNVFGNMISIADGDLIPSTTDLTDFGNVNMSSNLTQTFFIYNGGTGNLFIPSGGFTFSGANSSAFSVSNITLPATVALASYVAFNVTFTPGSVGLNTAVLHIENNDCDENTYDFALQGFGNCLPSSSSVAVSMQGCYTWPANGVTYSLSGIYTTTITNNANCDSVVTLNLTITPGVSLSLKALLTGPYNSAIGLMHDSLRMLGMIPNTEPYSNPPYNKTPIAETNGESVSSGVLSISGNNAIVDWVFLELRNASNPTQVIANKRALIQRDGDIVSASDGVSPVYFATVNNGSYYVTLKHRNHLGIMSANAISLSGCANTWLDMTSSSSVYNNIGIGNLPRKQIGSVFALWPSDANNNKNVKYNGISNDKEKILNVVGIATPNNEVIGYRVEDLNLDGKVRYNNADNDRQVIINTLGVNTPNSVFYQHTPN